MKRVFLFSLLAAMIGLNGLQTAGVDLLNFEDVRDIIKRDGRFDERAQSLDLSGLSIEEIAGTVFRQMQKAYPDLSSLNLSNNLLVYLSEDISWLRNLRVLDLSNNRLLGLPIGMHPYILAPPLVRLNLRNNRLPGVPAVLSAFTALRELDLRNNELTSVSAIEEMANKLSALEHLWLSGNQLPPPSTWRTVREALIRSNPKLHIHHHLQASPEISDRST